jgi:hypothetical protein
MHALNSSRIVRYTCWALVILGSIEPHAFAVESADVKRLVIRQQYWQVLPDVCWVNVDHVGDPWFCLPTGDIAKSYHQEFHTLPADLKMLWGDRTGRIWVQDRYRNEPVRFFDGQAWHETKIKARLFAEDDAGRLFLLDAHSIHVLDQDEWFQQAMFAEEAYPNGHFTQDAEHRMWFWARESSRSVGAPDGYPGTRGVWAFNDGKWTNYNTENGFPANDVETLLPLGTGRFLVVFADRESSPNFSVWSPDRKLTEIEASLFPKNEAPTRLSFNATDPNGKHFFSCRGATSERFTIDADNCVTFLSPQQIESSRSMLKGIYQNSNKLYSTLETPPPPTPVNPGEVICQDRHGRIYFRVHQGVGVLWPEYEKPGDTLHLNTERRMKQVFQDPSGMIWGQRYHEQPALFRWSGKNWQETPVKTPPHPSWRNRRGPPWYAWQVQSPVILTGENGTMLVIEVRDVYQEAESELMDGESVSWEKLNERAIELSDQRGSEYWFEGWLLQDEKWIGPLPVAELLQRQRVALIQNFTVQSQQTAPFNLQSDGENLWVAYDGSAWVYSEKDILEWKQPHQPKTGLAQACLCRLPDGRMLCCSSTNEYAHFQLHVLSLQDRKIRSEPFPLPDDAIYVSRNPRWNDWFPYVTRNGDLWLWLGYRTCQFQAGTWITREDLGRPLFEEPDGTLWFMPGKDYDGLDPQRGYRLVKGDKTSTFAWPIEYPFGWPTLSPTGEVHAACGYWQVTLSAADHPLDRKIIKARVNSRFFAGPIFEIEPGKFLFGDGSVGTESKNR